MPAANSIVDALPLLSLHGGGQALVDGEVVAVPPQGTGLYASSLYASSAASAAPQRTPGLYASSLYASSAGLHPQDPPRSVYASAESRPAARGANGEGAGGVSGECVRVLEGHEDAVYCCDWSGADGGRRFVLSGGGDETLRVWDADSGLRSCVRVFKEHTGAVWCCSWSPADGGRRWALSGSRDKTLRVFDVDTGACVTQFEGHGGSVHACGWSLGESAGRRIVSGSADRTIRVWDSHTGTCEQVLRGHTAAVMCAVWSEADGGCRWVLSGSDDKTLRVWDAATGACERILEGHSDPVLCCALSTAEGGRRWAISGSWDKNVHLWDCCALLVKKKETNMQKSLVKKLSGHTAPVYCCSWSTADGGARWALTGAYDETLRVWAVGSGTCLRTLHGHTRWVRSCAWSRSNGGKRWLVSGSRDKTVRVWELQWDGDNVPNDVKIEALSSSQVDMEEHPELHPDKRRMQQRAAAPPGAHALTNGADHGNGKEEQERARNVLLQSDHGALKEMLANDVEDLKRSLSSAEEERDVARALLQSKDAEAASLRLRCEELEAEVEALMRSVAQGHHARQQAQMELEACVAAARSEAQAEARMAIEQTLAEISRVSASNDRLAAELGEIEEVKMRCRQLEAETAVKMDAIIHRETQALERLHQAETALADSVQEAAHIRQLAEEDAQRVRLQARDEAARQLQELLQQGSQRVEEEVKRSEARDQERAREVEGRTEELAQARLRAERDAERIREDAAEAAREVAERMSEMMESEKRRASEAGRVQSPREGVVISMGSVRYKGHVTPHTATRAAPPPPPGAGEAAGEGAGTGKGTWVPTREEWVSPRPDNEGQGGLDDRGHVAPHRLGSASSAVSDGSKSKMSPSLKWRFI